MGTAAATTATLSRPTHAGINIAPQETIDKSVLSVCQQRRKVLGLGVLTPWKYVGGVRVCLTPKYVTFFHLKLLLDNSASFASSRIKDLCQKWKIFSIRRKQFDGLTGLILTPYFTADLRYSLPMNSSKIFSSDTMKNCC